MTHWLWAGLGALAVWPIKHIWETWIEKFWTAFWISFKAGFTKTPGGQEFLKAYHEGRAKKDKEIISEHPELRDMLTCKVCGGTGVKGTMHAGFGDMHPGDIFCEDCGGTGLV